MHNTWINVLCYVPSMLWSYIIVSFMHKHNVERAATFVLVLSLSTPAVVIYPQHLAWGWREKMGVSCEMFPCFWETVWRALKPAYLPASSPLHIPPPEMDASFCFSLVSLVPHLESILLLMPEHLRGRVTRGRGGCSRLTGFFISEQEVWFTSAMGRELSSGDLRANGLDLCAPLLLSAWTVLEDAHWSELF